jgi:hypothetical protein
MEKNNFQRLLDEDVNRLESEDAGQYKRIMGSVTSSLGFFRMLGDVADLYMSRAIGVMIMAAGGPAPDSKKDPASAPKSTPSSAPDRPNNDPGKAGPQGPGDLRS